MQIGLTAAAAAAPAPGERHRCRQRASGQDKLSVGPALVSSRSSCAGRPDQTLIPTHTRGRHGMAWQRDDGSTSMQGAHQGTVTHPLLISAGRCMSVLLSASCYDHREGPRGLHFRHCSLHFCLSSEHNVDNYLRAVHSDVKARASSGPTPTGLTIRILVVRPPCTTQSVAGATRLVGRGQN